MAAAVTMARMNELRDGTLRVSKEHEDDLLRSLQGHQWLLEHIDAQLHQEAENRLRSCMRCRFPSIVQFAVSSAQWRLKLCRGGSRTPRSRPESLRHRDRRTRARTARRDERKSPDGAHEASREWTARSAWCGRHMRQAPPDMLTGRSVQACLSREVPTDHEAHGQRCSGCGNRALLRSRDDSASAGVHPRGQGRTPSASGRGQHVKERV